MASAEADVLVHQQLDVRAVAVNHPSARQLARELVVAAAVPLQHRHGDLVGLERARHLEPDAPATDDEHLPGRCRRPAHEHEDVRDHVPTAHDVHVVLGGQHGVLRGHDETLAPRDADDAEGRGGLDRAEVAESTVHDRRLGTDLDAEKLDAAVGEVGHLGGSGGLDDAQDLAGDDLCRIDQEVDAEHLAAGEYRVLAELDVADPGDLGRHAVLVRDRAGHDVDLVHVRHRDHHRGVPNAGLFEGAGRRAVRLDRCALAGSSATRRTTSGSTFDDDDLVRLVGQPRGDVVADLARADHDDSHVSLSARRGAPGSRGSEPRRSGRRDGGFVGRRTRR